MVNLEVNHSKVNRNMVNKMHQLKVLAIKTISQLKIFKPKIKVVKDNIQPLRTGLRVQIENSLQLSRKLRYWVS